MLAFTEANPILHSAYLLLAFYEDRWDRSDIYMIPINVFNLFKQNWPKKSINRAEAKLHFDTCSSVNCLAGKTFSISVDKGILLWNL